MILPVCNRPILMTKLGSLAMIIFFPVSFLSKNRQDASNIFHSISTAPCNLTKHTIRASTYACSTAIRSMIRTQKCRMPARLWSFAGKQKSKLNENNYAIRIIITRNQYNNILAEQIQFYIDIHRNYIWYRRASYIMNC